MKGKNPNVRVYKISHSTVLRMITYEVCRMCGSCGHSVVWRWQ